MKHIGWFLEMGFTEQDSKSIKSYIKESVSYDKEKIVAYLKSQKRVAGCPRTAIDCLTGKQISPSFSVFSDGIYDWCDFLIYHIEKYNIDLPADFIAHVYNCAA